MNISGAASGLNPSQVQQNRPQGQNGPTVVGKVRVGGPPQPPVDSVDVSPAGSDLASSGSTRGLSPEQRVEQLASKIEGRLAEVAQDNGFGEEQMAALREAFGDFRSDLGRVSNGMPNESIGATVQNAISQLGAEARGLMADDQPSKMDVAAERGSTLARLESLQESTSSRISEVAQGLDFDGIQALRGVQAALDKSFGALAEGVQSGSLGIDDVRAGVQASLQSASEGARAALGAPDTGAPQAVSAGSEAEGARSTGMSESERVDAFREGVQGRIANIASSLAGGGADVSGVEAEFDALMNRVEQAFFTNGTEPLSKLGGALSNVIDQLRDSMGSAMESDDTVGLYDPASGMAPLDPGRETSVDYTI